VLGAIGVLQVVLARYERRLARALAHLINILDPDAIVLGGGLSNVPRWYETVPRLWGQWVFSDRVDTRLLRNRHGDSSGVRGAACLWQVKRTDRWSRPAARPPDRRPPSGAR
jgi:fructokinase